MTEIQTAEAVAALWFTVFFGLALLVPAFRAGTSRARSRRPDNDNQ